MDPAKSTRRAWQKLNASRISYFHKVSRKFSENRNGNIVGLSLLVRQIVDIIVAHHKSGAIPVDNNRRLIAVENSQDERMQSISVESETMVEAVRNNIIQSSRSCGYKHFPFCNSLNATPIFWVNRRFISFVGLDFVPRDRFAIHFSQLITKRRKHHSS